MDAAEVLKSVEAFTGYLENSTGAGERTVRAYASDVKSFALFLVHERRKGELTVGGVLIQTFVTWLRESRKNGPSTIRRKVIALSSYFRWRVKIGMSSASPVDEAEIFVRLPKRLPRALTRGDVAILLKSPKGTSTCSDTDLALRLFVATGIRIGEMCAIELWDIATDGSAIRIRGKGDRERTVFISNARLQASIAARAKKRRPEAEAQSALFVNRKGMRLTPQAFRLRLHQLVAERGIDARTTPHRLRHTAATLLIEEGVDIRFVQRLLGHASIATTEIYTKVVDSSLKAALIRADPLRHMQ